MKNSKKVFAMLLALVMVFSMMSMSVIATSDYPLTPYDSNITSIAISGTDVQTYTRTTEPLSSGSSNMRVTYNVVLSNTVSDSASLTINFTKPDGTVVSIIPPQGQPGQFIPMIQASASDTYTVTLSSGAGTKTLYVHKDFPATYQNCDIYIFNFTKSTLNNPVNTSTGVELRFGDPAYPNTAPECYMTFTGSGDTYTADYSIAGTYYPDVLSMLVKNNNGSITNIVGTGVQFATYDSSGTKTLYSTITPAQNGSNIYTVEIGSSGGNAKVYVGTTLMATVNFNAPHATTSAGGTAPTYVNGYLPLGQYATGTGWGSIYTNYGNAAGSTATDAVTKVTSGLATTGISIGAPGGYVQFEFENNVENSANNKYGIDFVIYGNPFNGNPEAASVQVSQDGNNWYELAGSRYYAEDTMHGATLTYTKKSDGIYYSINGGTAELYKSTLAWWPEDDEGYDGVDGIDTIFQGSKYAANVTRGTNSNGEPTITFSNLNLVKDTDYTDDYLFGYADVRQVGNTTDGTACNPYATLPSTATGSMIGGDGFDISWAVNSNGEPVNLSYIKYVRVYTSAALDPNDLTAMPTPGVFGETSAEICGVFVAQKETSSVNTTTKATVKLDGTTISGGGTQVSSTQRYIESTVSAGSHTLSAYASSSSTLLFVNGQQVTGTSSSAPHDISVTLAAGDVVTYQFITQLNNRQAYIEVVKLVCNG